MYQKSGKKYHHKYTPGDFSQLAINWQMTLYPNRASQSEKGPDSGLWAEDS